MNQSSLFPAPVPLVVGYGMGLDSTAMLVEMHNRGIRPDLIQHAHTGGEWPHTYAYRKVIDAWLKSVEFPAIVDCRYVPKTARYDTLEGNCLANETLPSLAFGKHSCSIKFKAEPQNRYLRSWLPAVECWGSGGRVRKALGYDAGPQDRKRAIRALRYAPPNYDFWYPLQDWEMDREACERVIAAAGLPVPRKSSCYFCPAAKKSEIVQLRDAHPILFRRALKMEAVFLAGKHARKAEPTTEKGRKGRPTVGLGRNFAWSALANVAKVEDDGKELARP